MRFFLKAALSAALLVATTLQTIHGALIPARISTSNTVIGVSADTYGINAGHAFSKGNWQMWLDRSGVNSLRLFLAPRKDLREAVGDSFGKSISGKTVSNLEAFTAAVLQLRTPEGHNPAATWANPVNWTIYERGLSDNKLRPLGNPNYIVSVCNVKGIKVQAQIGLSCRSTTRFQLYEFSTNSSAYWEERWALYQYVYGLSRWMWIRSIQYIELYNEPDIDNECKLPEVYEQNLEIRAKAVRDAYADLNAEAPADKRINAIIGAPSTANIKFPGSLGQLAVKTVNKKFLNGTSSDWKNFDEFTYHFYGGPGYDVDFFYKELAQEVHKVVPNLPISITEYNNYYGRKFELIPQTMDSADQAADFGDITANLLFNTKRLFVFKFSETLKSNRSNGSGVMKNGLLFAENDIAPFNIGDSTRTFEVYHTIIQHCVDKQLYKLSSSDSEKSNFTTWAVQDNSNWHLYVVNARPDARDVSVDLSGWSIASGAIVLINEISERYMNQIATIAKVDGSSKVNFYTPRFSVMMLTIPIRGTPQEVSRPADECATVNAGVKQYVKNKGGNLDVKLSPGSVHDATAVSYLKFKVGIDPTRITAAYLQLYVISSGPIESKLLILATSPSWSESKIVWANAPNLEPLNNGTSVKSIGDNPIKYSKPLPAVAGHITVAARATGAQRIDVTSYLKKYGVQTASFQISRIKRFNANGQSGGDVLGDNSVTFASCSANSSAEIPKLVVFYN